MKYMKLGSKPDLFQTDGSNIRFVATELASDIIVKVGDVKFYLHKFPLLSKSSRLQKLVAVINEQSTDETDISNIPGGPSAFEMCAKFCYGMIVTLNAYNVVAARCASGYLEMHETIEKGNLIYKIEVFLNSSIFRNWKDSIIVLQTTKSLEPWSEDLKLVSRCIDSIASKASIDPSGVEWPYTYNRKNEVRKPHSVPKDWWIEDLCEHEMDFYKRVIMNIKIKGRLSPKTYWRSFKGIYIYIHTRGILSHGDAMRNRVMLETIFWLLPREKGWVSCSILLKLLKAAILLYSEENCKKDSVKRMRRQLHEASVHDLLIHSSDGENTIYDVDVILIIVEEFVMQEQRSGETSPEISEELMEVRSPIFVSESSKIAVASLVDGYLAEVSKDPNLPMSKFIELAEMVSNSSRPVHDGLYRAIDMYMKEHPDLTKSEKKKICSLMDCKKLSPGACSHALQNERLPLRLVVQILFFEQIRASAAITTTTTTGDLDPPGLFGSSRSAAATNTEDEWDNNPKSADSVGRASEQCNGSDSVGDDNKMGNGEVKGITMPKKLLSKLWSNKGRSGENSSLDTSESPGGSVHPEAKSTPSRNTRHSVS